MGEKPVICDECRQSMERNGVTNYVYAESLSSSFGDVAFEQFCVGEDEKNRKRLEQAKYCVKMDNFTCHRCDVDKTLEVFEMAKFDDRDSWTEVSNDMYEGFWFVEYHFGSREIAGVEAMWKRWISRNPDPSEPRNEPAEKRKEFVLPVQTPFGVYNLHWDERGRIVCATEHKDFEADRDAGMRPPFGNEEHHLGLSEPEVISVDSPKVAATSSGKYVSGQVPVFIQMPDKFQPVSNPEMIYDKRDGKFRFAVEVAPMPEGHGTSNDLPFMFFTPPGKTEVIVRRCEWNHKNDSGPLVAVSMKANANPNELFVGKFGSKYQWDSRVDQVTCADVSVGPAGVSKMSQEFMRNAMYASMQNKTLSGAFFVGTDAAGKFSGEQLLIVKMSQSASTAAVSFGDFLSLKKE